MGGFGQRSDHLIPSEGPDHMQALEEGSPFVGAASGPIRRDISSTLST